MSKYNNVSNNGFIAKCGKFVIKCYRLCKKWNDIVVDSIASKRWAYILLIAILVSSKAYKQYKNNNPNETSTRIVKAHQLEFTDLQMRILSEDDVSYMWMDSNKVSGYRLTGRVKNYSQYKVDQIKMKFRILDCDNKTHCSIVGEMKDVITFLNPLNEMDVLPWEDHTRGTRALFNLSNEVNVLPSNQYSDIDTSIYFDKNSIQVLCIQPVSSHSNHASCGRFQWDYEIIEIRARK